MKHYSQNGGDTLRPVTFADLANDGKSTVRIMGQRLGRFIEFEYSLNDEDLTVELVMPFKAFEEFCTTQNATIIKNQDNSEEEILWRMKNPGLLRKVNH